MNILMRIFQTSFAAILLAGNVLNDNGSLHVTDQLVLHCLAISR